jgi:cytochrome c oxidase subunit 2
MLFRAIVVPKEEFDRFVAAAKSYTPPVADARGQQVFQQNCAACHSVQAKMPPAVIGPELAFTGNRVGLAAGIVDYTPENMKAWIRDPAAMKPGVKMPGFPQLSEEDLEALVRYLEGLKVEGFDFKALPKF